MCRARMCSVWVCVRRKALMCACVHTWESVCVCVCVYIRLCACVYGLYEHMCCKWVWHACMGPVLHVYSHVGMFEYKCVHTLTPST